jgi:hypothetical protein
VWFFINADPQIAFGVSGLQTAAEIAALPSPYSTGPALAPAEANSPVEKREEDYLPPAQKSEEPLFPA